MQRSNYPSWTQIQNQEQQQQQQTQFPPARTSFPCAAIGPAASSSNCLFGPLGPPKPIWKYFQDLEFYKDSSSSWRLCVCTIDDKPFVCISHWFWSKASAQWMPSRRQINLQKEVFLNLQEKIGQVTNSLKNLEEPNAKGRWIANESFMYFVHLLYIYMKSTNTFIKTHS